MTDIEPKEEPKIALRCERERCDYVVYGDPDNPEHVAEAQTYYADHLEQHDDPEGWKARHQVEPEGEEG